MIGAIVTCNNITHSVIMDVTRTLIITPIIIIPIGVEVVQAHSQTSFFNKINTTPNHHHKEDNKYKKFYFPWYKSAPHPHPGNTQGFPVSMTTPHFPFEGVALGVKDHQCSLEPIFKMQQLPEIWFMK